MKIIDYLKVLYHYCIIDKNTSKFIDFNKDFWAKNNNKVNQNRIILVDFFDWYPWILIWSLFANFLSKKYKARIGYFYFPLYESPLAKHNFFLRVRKKIYNSFNAYEILNEINFKTNKRKIQFYKKIFKKKIRSKSDLLNFSYKGIEFGDLIYDSYLRVTLKPTLINLNDKLIEDLFIRALINFNEIEKIFKKYDVKSVISSHTCYFQYGLVARCAFKKKIPVYCSRGTSQGRKRLGMQLADKKTLRYFDPYHNYKKIFNSLNIKEKRKNIKIGKQIIQNRFSGSYGKYLPHMKNWNEQDKNLVENFKLEKNKKKYVIYSHCFWDYVHKFRHSIFYDFQHWIEETIKILQKKKNIQIFIKPHPNDYQNNIKTLKLIKNKYPEIIILSNVHNLNYITKLKPELVISVYGTVGHELPLKKIPVLNAGDNHHVSFNFCLTAKNYKDYKNKILNIDYYKKQINFNKEDIYKFCYMHYHYFYTLYDRENLINDDMFSFDDISKSNSSRNLIKFVKNFDQIYKNFNKYSEKLFEDTKK